MDQKALIDRVQLKLCVPTLTSTLNSMKIFIKNPHVQENSFKAIYLLYTINNSMGFLLFCENSSPFFLRFFLLSRLSTKR
jgi:hypothetical protein